MSDQHITMDDKEAKLIDKYEEKFGVIETPKHLKEAANKKEDGDEHKTEIPSYFG